MNADEQAVVLESRLIDLGELEDLGAAVAVVDDGFHAILPTMLLVWAPSDIVWFLR
jgi:hypothetical protein